MQTSFLPFSLCDQIDRKIRDFIWGSGDGIRKLHNINWETVCKPKSLGGLGLRSAREMNMAFLMKVAWGLLTRPDELWAKVLLTKYIRNTEEGYIAVKTKGFSAVWRGVRRAGPILNKGSQWAIRSGAQTKFWTDKWLDSGITLLNHALDIQEVSINSVVKDFVLDSGIWNASLIFSCLPSHIALQVLGMTPPSDSLGPDSMVWGLEPTGKFTIRSAYLLLTDLQEEQPDPRWKRIWKWQGPNKIRHFLWLASHNRLLTNEERGRRHLTNQVLCSFCSDHTESCIHILRDCRFAKQFWSKIMPQVISGEELSKDGSNWLDTHVCHRELCSRQWEVTISHIYREANFAADYLANLGHSLPYGMHLFDSSDRGLSHWLHYDLFGISLTRFVRVSNNT
ncbi:Putative ribonuclease H protein At1g65750 [Linum grandiflorum]